MQTRSLRLAAMFAAVVSAHSAFAADLKLPAAKPTVSVSIPDTWKPEFTTRGVQAQTSDNNVYLAVEATNDPKEMATIIDTSDATLKARKVRLDRATRRNNKFKVNNFPAEEIRYTGIDENGSVTVTFTFVTIRDSAVVFTYLANAEGHQQHQAELGKIIDSIKALAPVVVPLANP